MTLTPVAPRVGDVLPDIALPTLDGRMVHLSEYRGKRLLLFMWASW
ncbi:MAG TPA: redoxin domain-containing protein [Chloroflexota bacterium]|jgi:peroxiredoxin|nr:redoxin domain-containing protein [Chloroflexota bacterium]